MCLMTWWISSWTWKVSSGDTLPTHFITNYPKHSKHPEQHVPAADQDQDRLWLTVMLMRTDRVIQVSVTGPCYHENVRQKSDFWHWPLIVIILMCLVKSDISLYTLREFIFRLRQFYPRVYHRAKYIQYRKLSNNVFSDEKYFSDHWNIGLKHLIIFLRSGSYDNYYEADG